MTLSTTVGENLPVPRHEPRAPTTRRRAIPALTGLRFFAALHVIVFHTRIKSELYARGHLYAGNFFANGFLAVTLFFMLSGFILAYNYNGQISSLGHAIRFWEARYARIWPAYLFSLLCSSIPLSNVPSFWPAVATIFMVQAWNPFRAQCGYWNMVCWSLSVEAFFYLLFPWLQTTIEKLRRSHLLGFGILIGALGILGNIPNHIMSIRYSGPFFYIIVPIIHLPEFITGMILGNLFLTNRITHSENRCRLQAGDEFGTLSQRNRFPWITAVGFISSVVVMLITRSRWESLVIATFSLLLYGLAAEQSPLSRFLSTPALILGGEISYSMYLLRTPLHGWLSLSPALSASSLVTLLYIPLGLIPLSLFSYFVIETSARRGLRRMFANMHRS